MRTNVTWPSQINSQWHVPKASSWYPSNNYLSYFSKDKAAFEMSTPLVLEEAECAGKPFLAPDESFVPHSAMLFWQTY